MNDSNHSLSRNLHDPDSASANPESAAVPPSTQVPGQTDIQIGINGNTAQKSQTTEATTTDENEERLCWICLATEEENRLATWLQPCKCRGTNKWVHEVCLYRWIDEKQRGNVRRPVRCPQCQTEYIIVLPPVGPLTDMLEAMDNIIKRLSPLLATGIIFSFIYWNALTYGAITILQVFDAKEGLAFMENCSPIILLVGLPAIPVGLIFARMIRWEDAILNLIRNRRSIIRKIPLINYAAPYPEDDEQLEQDPVVPAFTSRVSVTRTFCGALLLPTISCIVGNVLFESVENTVHRTLLGGMTFIAVKGIMKIYLKQMHYITLKERKVLKYSEENMRTYMNRDSLRQRVLAENGDQQLQESQIPGLIHESGSIV